MKHIIAGSIMIIIFILIIYLGIMNVWTWGVLMTMLVFLIGLIAGGSFGYILAAVMNIRGREDEES